MADARCDRCRQAGEPLTSITFRGSVSSLTLRFCHECHGQMLADGTIQAEVPSREGSDWLIVPAQCMCRLLFARHLRQTGRLSEGEPPKPRAGLIERVLGR